MEGNETSWVARLSIKMQMACEDHPRSPFSSCWDKQKLRAQSTGPLFHPEVWERGFVANLKKVGLAPLP